MCKAKKHERKKYVGSVRCAVSRGTSQQGFVECPNGPKLQRGSSPGSKTPEAWKVLGNLSVVASNFGEDDILEPMRCRAWGGRDGCG